MVLHGKGPSEPGCGAQGSGRFNYWALGRPRYEQSAAVSYLPAAGSSHALNFPCFASVSRRFTSFQFTTAQNALTHSARRFSYCR